MQLGECAFYSPSCRESEERQCRLYWETDSELQEWGVRLQTDKVIIIRQ